MSSETDDAGYVHDPSAFDEDGERADDESTDDADARLAGMYPTASDRSFDWRGWTLVAVLVFAFFVAPALIVWRPPSLPYWVALLALPMLPGILLGVLAVWATTRP